jgi:ammonium transporter, Amt family
MLFQMMFAIITPGAHQRRGGGTDQIQGYVLFMVLWVTVVYFPLCHMVWGKGGLFNWALGGKFRCWILPAARWCTSVPASRRWSARWCWASASGYPQEPMMPHNVVLSLIGTGCLWVGWFGFNAGSALNAGALATSAFAATHFSAAAAALSWAATEWLHKGKPSVLGAASGMVAGLATITPASGFVSVPAAFCIGLAAGGLLFCRDRKLKAPLRLRRFAGRVRRAWRRQHDGHVDARLSGQRGR